jgi:cyclophilin family peptidyl-prolyl cis-trans isomerase
MPPAEAGLLSVEPVKNARALLRYSLPIKNDKIRDIQKSLESVSEQLRIPGSKSLGPIGQSVRRAQGTLNANKGKLEAEFAPEHKAEGQAAIEKLDAALKEFQAVVDANDKQSVIEKQQQALTYVGAIEEAMVKGFPFTVPSEYDNLPQLKGRATVEMGLTFKTARDNGIKGGLIRIVVDGYNAPVTAGNFVDLVSRKFYDGLTIQRADGFIVQTGDPDGPATGFVDEATGKNRTVPFEIMVQGDKTPVYEENLEDNGRFNEQPVLPFNAYGTLAMARSEFESNDASSQFFFLLKESELTPTGSNLLDGRFAVFGYVVDNADLLGELQVGDKIDFMKVVDGLQNLQAPKAGATAQPMGDDRAV